MKAGKAYISSLGTTGLLVASSVLLLVVVGALFAFDRWPAGSSSGRADAIVIGAADDVSRLRTVSAGRRQARVERRRAARARAARRQARARAARRDAQTGAGVTALPGGPVISGHGSPDSAPGGAAPGGSPAGGAAGTRGAAPGTDRGDTPAGLVGDAVAGIEAGTGAGQAVGGVGGTADEALNTPLETLDPQLAP